MKTIRPRLLRVEDFHRGYGGADAAFLATNIGNWLNADAPDVILLMIGINSIGQGGTSNPTAAENNLKAILSSMGGIAHRSSRKNA